ncbi:MAG: response regulator [Gammaproteobacteria bacterium]|nr:MAG: response regulator [Gammaproteobacteria bacterium]
MSSAAARLLIVDDEAPLLRALCDTLAHEGYLTQGFTSGREALAALRERSFDLLLTDLTMPELDGIALLRACREIDRELACIVMTGQGTIATAVDALKTGALDYVLKPFKVNNILPVLARALATRRLQLENIQLRESVSIYELSRAITRGLEHGDVVERTLAAAGQHSDVSAVYLLVPTDDGRALRLAGKTGPGAQALQSAAGLLEGSAERWVAQARRQLEAQAGDGDPRVFFAHPFDGRIGVALPIVAGGKFFGVLGFSSSRSQQRISPGQLKALEILARTAATAFETAALVTQLRRMNEELELRVRERTRDLEIANRDLEAFSYSVSHDLREPLRAVEGFCEMFRTEFGSSVPEPGRRILERVWAGASRMTRLVNDLLHFSRFSREPLHRLRVPLRELVLQTVARLKEPLGERQPSVQVGDLPDCFGDRSLLEQVRRIAAPTRARRSISACRHNPTRQGPMVRRSPRPRAWTCVTRPGNARDCDAKDCDADPERAPSWRCLIETVSNTHTVEWPMNCCAFSRALSCPVRAGLTPGAPRAADGRAH